MHLEVLPATAAWQHVGSDNFSISGIALGTIVVLVTYHAVRVLAPPHLREEPGRGALLVTGEGSETMTR